MDIAVNFMRFMAIRTDKIGGEGVRRLAVIFAETDRLPQKNSGKWGQRKLPLIKALFSWNPYDGLALLIE